MSLKHHIMLILTLYRCRSNKLSIKDKVTEAFHNIQSDNIGNICDKLMDVMSLIDTNNPISSKLYKKSNKILLDSLITVNKNDSAAIVNVISSLMKTL